jgi:hypothetical protein
MLILVFGCCIVGLIVADVATILEVAHRTTISTG